MVCLHIVRKRRNCVLYNNSDPRALFSISNPYSSPIALECFRLFLIIRTAFSPVTFTIQERRVCTQFKNT